MDESGADHIDAGDQELDSNYSHDGISPDGLDSQGMGSTMEVLMRLDMELAFSFNKLLNLNIFSMHMLTGKNHNGAAMENNFILPHSSEMTLAFDYLFGIIDSEVRELQDVMDTLQTEFVDAQQKIPSDGLRELLSVAEEKLHDCKVYLKQSQENVLKMKMQSDKMQRALLASQHENWRNDKGMEYSENGQLSRANTDSDIQIAKQQREILRMLEESLARELDLEKKISELKQSEVELQLKLQLTEQVAFCMEEAAEVAWGRFLEAENASEVLMGISKELVGKLQIVQFNLNRSIQREGELKSRPHDCTEQLKASQNAIFKLESENANSTTNLQGAEDYVDDSDDFDLKEKVKALEEQLNESGLQLESANASRKFYMEQLNEKENVMESLNESISKAESRVESAEAKLSVLTEANLELTEELGFLKGNENNAEKVGSLEKNLRELEIQFQQAKASSEASQKQQIMLYSAILDMETLISDLKSKVTIAESKTETAEEQRNTLSDANSKLSEEISFLKSRMGSLEMYLCQANDAKAARAKDINVTTKLMMDMVTQLTIERGLIQNQLHSFIKENKYLVRKLKGTKKDASQIIHDNKDGDTEEFLFSSQDSTNANCRITSEEVAVDSSSEISKAGG